MKSINAWLTNGKHARRGTRQLPPRSPRASVIYLPSSSTSSLVNGLSLGLASSTRVRVVQTSLGHPGAVRFALLRGKRRSALIPYVLISGYVCVCVHMCACVSRTWAKIGGLEPDPHGRHQCGAARRKCIWYEFMHFNVRARILRSCIIAHLFCLLYFAATKRKGLE